MAGGTRDERRARASLLRLRPWVGEHACGHMAYVAMSEADSLSDQQRKGEQRSLSVCDRCRVDGKLLCGCGGCRQPPEYAGRLWEHATNEGVIMLPCPPMRFDTQMPPIAEFTDFQMHQSTRFNGQQHPEWFCQECGIHPISLGGRRCAWCLAKDPEVQAQMKLEAAQKAARKTKAAPKGAGTTEGGYPL
jgi:hypothetical protein